MRNHGKAASTFTLAALSSLMIFGPPLSAYASPTASAKPASTPKNKRQYPPRIAIAINLYENLEYEAALGQFEAAKGTVERVEDWVVISFYQGIIFAHLAQMERARVAFRIGLRLKPSAPLPVPVSPKIATEFQSVQEEIQSNPLPRPPPEPIPVASEKSSQPPQVDVDPVAKSPPVVTSSSQPAHRQEPHPSVPSTPVSSPSVESAAKPPSPPVLAPEPQQPSASSLLDAHASAPQSPTLPKSQGVNFPPTPAAKPPVQSAAQPPSPSALAPEPQQPSASSPQGAHASAPQSPPLKSRGSIYGQRALMGVGGVMAITGVVTHLNAQKADPSRISAQESVGAFLGVGGALVFGVGLLLELSIPSEVSASPQRSARPVVSFQNQGVVVGTWMSF